MILVFADIHFGKGEAAAERRKERELIACVEAVGDELREIILLGDVFEQYIEYRYVVPKGFSRFLGLLARLADKGVAITYFAGNHDPWHRDYYSTEFGARFVADEEIRNLNGRRFYLFHGDGAERNGGLYRTLKRIIRHPLPVGGYTTILPADAGMALARWVSRRFGSRGRSASTVEGLRRMAADLINGDAADVVVMGHSHHPELTPIGDGLYLNPGSWHYQKTFAILTPAGPQLARWVSDGIQLAEPRWPTGPTQTKSSIATFPIGDPDAAAMGGKTVG